MSETAQTLIKAAYRLIGMYDPGETPTADEMANGYEALKFMLRNWSANNLRIYYTKQETLTMTGATYYTIGSGGDLNTTRPASIRGAWTADGAVGVISEDRYRQVRMDAAAGSEVCQIWYSPEYPLGKIYPWPLGGTTLYLDTQIPLTDPATLTTDVAFPPEYDEAIKYGLAVRLAPEFGMDASQTVQAMAAMAIGSIENRNFAEQMDTVRPELIKLSYGRYNIDND